MKPTNDIDRLLEKARGGLQQKAAPPYLWRNIAAELEKPGQSRTSLLEWISQVFLKPAIIASVVLTIIFIASVISITDHQSLITPRKAVRYALEIDQRLYPQLDVFEKEIDKVEHIVFTSNISKTDDQFQPDFARVLMLDVLITECKSSLKYNPFNPTLLKSLVSGYQGKLDTLIKLRTQIEKRHV